MMEDVQGVGKIKNTVSSPVVVLGLFVVPYVVSAVTVMHVLLFVLHVSDVRVGW